MVQLFGEWILDAKQLSEDVAFPDSGGRRHVKIVLGQAHGLYAEMSSAIVDGDWDRAHASHTVAEYISEEVIGPSVDKYEISGEFLSNVAIK